MTRAENDDRCWHELPFDELADEAEAIARRRNDDVLHRLVRDLRKMPLHWTADFVIDRIETEHVGPFNTELTPEGEQTVIPGCERNASPKVAQLSLW